MFISGVRTIVAAVEAKDRFTRGHSGRVTAYGLAMCDILSADSQVRKVVKISGLLHDVGKISVPEAILNKPDSLSEREYEIVKQHSADGARIIKNMNHPYIEEVAKIIRAHHERFDGAGYPDNLAGEYGHLVPIQAENKYLISISPDNPVWLEPHTLLPPSDD